MSLADFALFGGSHLRLFAAIFFFAPLRLCVFALISYLYVA
jgi:hypothetical protein